MASSSTSTSDDVYSEKVLGLRHKIFLSYSGADQAFLWELYDDLLEHDYDPFFDQKSLPKATPVSMGNIVQEAADSKLAVFFLSEAFFTRNKNPMLELVECVKKKVRLLPLFYEISVEMIKKSMESWHSGKWSQWGVDQNEFKEALETLLHMSGIENKEGSRPREFRRRVVEEIQKIVPPLILPDISGICGGDRLIKVVKNMFEHLLRHDKSTHPSAFALGLYGASGTGKSTLCRLLQHSESPVCYIQLDSCMDKTTQLGRMKKVLNYATNLSMGILDKITRPAEAIFKLHKCSHEKKMFLIIDNVTLESFEEAEIYLDGKFKPGSKVLITAHTKDVFCGLRQVGSFKWHIAAMPDLEKEEATWILVKREGSKVKEELVERCLKLCLFGKGGGKGVHYHPLVLNALAESLKHYNSNHEKMATWVATLETSFSHTEVDAKGKVLQHLLRSTSYNLLSDLQKQVFLDFAFYLPNCIEGEGEILEWLCLVHKKNIKEAVNILKRRGLIDLSALLMGRSHVHFPLMHDLYYEMASLIVEEKESECLVLRGDWSDKELPRNCENIKRIRFDKCHLHGDLVMKNFTYLQVLAIVDCEGVGKLDLRRAHCLRSLDYSCWGMNNPKVLLIMGLDSCIFLVHLSGIHISVRRLGSPPNKGIQTFHSNVQYIGRKSQDVVAHLPNLRYLKLDLDGIAFDPPLDITTSIHLNCLILNNSIEHPDLRAFKNLRVFHYAASKFYFRPKRQYNCGPIEFYFGHTIENICIMACNDVSGLRGLNQNCTSLRELVLVHCKALQTVEDLCELKSLERLWLEDLDLIELPRELLKLPNQIQDLSIERCSLQIPPEDTIAVLSTPGLPNSFYLTSISIFMERGWKDIREEHIKININKNLYEEFETDIKVEESAWKRRLLDPRSWEFVLSRIMESKEALDTISKLLQEHFYSIDLVTLVFYLCFGGRHENLKLKELLSKPHVVEAFSKLQQPFCLPLLALANQHFGADLQSHASTIATMVAKTYLDERGPYKKWSCFRKCAASIATTNECVMQQLPPELHQRVLDMVNSASYDVTQELHYFLPKLVSIPRGRDFAQGPIDYSEIHDVHFTHGRERVRNHPRHILSKQRRAAGCWDFLF